jgi:uncharacterized secreted protein with C-terminal beta-propeller domain
MKYSSFLSNGGYIFSYANNKLTLKKVVSGSMWKSIVINEYLYVVSDTSILF